MLKKLSFEWVENLQNVWAATFFPMIPTYQGLPSLTYLTGQPTFKNSSTTCCSIEKTS